VATFAVMNKNFIGNRKTKRIIKEGTMNRIKSKRAS